MYPYRVVVHTDRRSQGLSKIPDIPDTLTHQSAILETMPPGTCFMYPLHGIFSRHGAIVYDYIFFYIISIPFHVAISVSIITHIEPTHCLWMLSDTSAVINIGSFAMFTIPDLI